MTRLTPFIPTIKEDCRCQAEATLAPANDDTDQASYGAGKTPHIENIVTGLVAEIDLSRASVPQKKTKNINSKINWAKAKDIIATLPTDDLDQIFTILKLQEHADERNHEARLNKSTDRFCRCGALAETAWRTKDNSELWRCNECIVRAGG